MENKSENYKEILGDNLWILINLIAKIAFSIASYVYRKSPEKIATICFIESLLAILLTALNILKIKCCCKIKNEEAMAIEEGKKLLSLFIKEPKIIEDLKKFKDKNEEAKKILNDIKGKGLNFINNINNI